MLQGSLDNFGLDEVLGLLADTAKTGRMRITGDRGSGSLWLASGQLIGSEASRADAAGAIDEIMFELLRFSTGNFSFNSDETPAEPREAEAVAEVLDAAFERLRQWRDIERVVPSLAHVIAPVATLPAPEMTISAAEWDLLMAIGAGTEVGTVCEHFGLGEVEGSRRVKLLVERSLITIVPPSPATLAAADSDDFGLAPAGLTTDEIVAPVAAATATTSVGAFDATPTESGFLDPGERSWVSSASADAAAHEGTATATSSAPEAIGSASAGLEPGAFESGAFEPGAFESGAFESGVSESGAFEADGFELEADQAPTAREAFDHVAPDDRPPAPATNEFSFRPDPPSMEALGAPLRRASDALPPPPPPAPPAAFDHFDAPAPPPPAPPSPADLVGSERVDGAEARRLLSGRGTERYDADDHGFPADEEDDGSLLMQYLRDES